MLRGLIFKPNQSFLILSIMNTTTGRRVISDIRGAAYKNNQLTVSPKGFVYYGDMPVDYFKRSKNTIFPSKSIYTIFGLRGLELADIALSGIDVQELNELFAI